MGDLMIIIHGSRFIFFLLETFQNFIVEDNFETIYIWGEIVQEFLISIAISQFHNDPSRFLKLLFLFLHAIAQNSVQN